MDEGRSITLRISNVSGVPGDSMPSLRKMNRICELASPHFTGKEVIFDSMSNETVRHSGAVQSSSMS